MENNRRKNTNDKLSRRSPLEKFVIFLILLFLASVLIATYSVVRKTASRVSADFYFPFLKSIRKAERSMANSLLIMEDKRTLAKAVLQLRQEKFSLLARESMYQSLRAENARLRRMLRMPARKNFKIVFAQLLYRDEANSSTLFMLDKGENDGIKPGSIVVMTVRDKNSRKSFTAVAGRVLEVSRHTSTVAGIYDHEFKLSVRFGNTNGVMLSQKEFTYPLCGITFIPVHAKIRKNEIVYTSDLTGNAPAGLPVGRIQGGFTKKSGLNKDHVYQTCSIQPFADPTTLYFAAVYVRIPEPTSGKKP